MAVDCAEGDTCVPFYIATATTVFGKFLRLLTGYPHPFIASLLSSIDDPLRAYLTITSTEISPLLTLLNVLTLVSFVRWVIGTVKWALTNDPRGCVQSILSCAYSFVKKLPLSYVRGKLTETKKKFLLDAVKHFAEGELPVTVKVLPAKGIKKDRLMKALESYSTPLGEIKMEGSTEVTAWRVGKSSGSVYMPRRDYDNGEHIEVCRRAYGYFTEANPLHMDQFPAVQKFEREILRMALDLFNAPPAACGILSSGGTESILLACLAYRQHCRRVWPHVKVPEIVAPESVHPAFHKASLYFGLKIVYVPIDPDTLSVTAAKMESYITKNTILLVASTPCYPFGAIDPVADIAALASKKKIFCHVDACLGGFYLCFADRLKLGIPKFDFRVPGVSSISADTHKYAMAPKGTSTVMFRDVLVRNSAFYTNSSFQGGHYGSPTLAGSRPGALIAGCWAAMMKTGMEGYLDITKKIHDTVRVIEEGVKTIKGAKLGISPLGPLVFITADESASFNPFQLSDVMKKDMGWVIDTTQRPSGFHFCLSAQNIGVGEQFVSDLRKAVEIITKDPKKYEEGARAVYGISSTAPVELMETMSGEVMAYMIDGRVIHADGSVTEVLPGGGEEEGEEEGEI